MRNAEENDGETDEAVSVFDDTRYVDKAPNTVEQLVCSVSVKSSVDQLCTALDAADWLVARAKSISYLSRQVAIKWIEKNGEFDVGDIHYKVAYSHVTRCTNPKQTGLQLLDDLGGDFSTFLDVLVAQPFKPGSAKRIMDQKTYNHLFSMKLASRLVAGVPERSLVRSNTRFANR